MVKRGILIEEHKVSDLFNKLDKIHEQVKKTNGRVTQLEKVGIGNWISNHPFIFALLALTFFAVVISDIRHPILEMVWGFISVLK